MSYRVDMDETTRNLLRHLHPRRKQNIRESLRVLSVDPFLGKPLEEEFEGYYSCRVGNFRIVYSVDRPQKTVHVVAIGPRSFIYKDLYRELIIRRRKERH